MSIIRDNIRGNYRVIVTVNGQRVFRRADTHGQALAIEHSLLWCQGRDAFSRLRGGDTLLDLTGLTDEQIAALLAVIGSWGIAQPLREVWP